MKLPNLDKALHIVGIIVAAGGLFSAIFKPEDETKVLKDQITDMRKRIDNLENK
jgi:hypothetical protein